MNRRSNCPITLTGTGRALILSKPTVSLTVQLPHRRWRLRRSTVCLRPALHELLQRQSFPIPDPQYILWARGALLWLSRRRLLLPSRHTVKVTETPKIPSLPTHTILISSVRNLLATWAKTFGLALPHRFMQSVPRYMPSRLILLL